MISLKIKDRWARVDNGELIGYSVDGHEFMHQKGSPGWRNTDTEMFPIIGPTAEAGFQVQTPKGTAVQDQHGLLREMPYELISQSETQATYLKKYKAGSRVVNSKYPEKSDEKELFWPYDFEFEKRIRILESGLSVSFKINAENGMPFMLGYHPAFRLSVKNPNVKANGRSISLAEVLAVGSRALHVPDCNEIVLSDAKRLRIKTEGFKSFMLWTEVPNMVCIEPITFYPYAVEQRNLHQGFQTLESSSASFKVTISPE
ncbi:aldose 1-epimerase [Maribacter algicola]|uniref:Aldose 1-epimerase n=1 Tax=Meishania litoralis TaxID=3434685 RepID=A0ACC7LG86_9FLAO